ncbi:1-aminocyclopropane-1-carboxylate oxidase like protein 3 [Quercus suber]|uniref:1-aminocyclopropane-1-carboxylate oxidase like protein 3 n=1 Tax=Quercus suber TaxID=58331 RepID=A0AAW0II78_QUESU
MTPSLCFYKTILVASKFCIRTSGLLSLSCLGLYALVVNIGDLLQLVTNDRFKSIEHRVLENQVGPRVSVACLFCTGLQPSPKPYGPIKDLLSEDNPLKYRETTVKDYCNYFNEKGFGGTSALPHFWL